MSNILANSDNLGDVLGDHNLVRPEVGIRRDDSPGCEIGPLSREILPKPTLLPLESVAE